MHPVNFYGKMPNYADYQNPPKQNLPARIQEPQQKKSSGTYKRVTAFITAAAAAAGLYLGTIAPKSVPVNENEKAATYGEVLYTKSEVAPVYRRALSHESREKLDEITNSVIKIKNKKIERTREIWGNFPTLYRITKNQGAILDPDKPLYERPVVEGYKELYESYNFFQILASGNMAPVDNIETPEMAMFLIDGILSAVSNSTVSHFEVNSSSYVNSGEMAVVYKVLNRLQKHGGTIEAIANLYKEELEKQRHEALKEKTLNDFVARINEDSTGAYTKFLLKNYDKIMENVSYFNYSEELYNIAKERYKKQPTEENFASLYVADERRSGAFNGVMYSLDLDCNEEDPSIVMDRGKIEIVIRNAKAAMGINTGKTGKKENENIVPM